MVEGEGAEEAEATISKRGMVAATTEEVGVAKTAHNIVELKTSENEKNAPQKLTTTKRP